MLKPGLGNRTIDECRRMFKNGMAILEQSFFGVLKL